MEAMTVKMPLQWHVTAKMMEYPRHSSSWGRSLLAHLQCSDHCPPIIHTPSTSTRCCRNQSGLVRPPLFLLTIRLLMHNNISWWQGGKGGAGKLKQGNKERGGEAWLPGPRLTFYLGFIFGNDLFVFLELSLRWHLPTWPQALTGYLIYFSFFFPSSLSSPGNHTALVDFTGLGANLFHLAAEPGEKSLSFWKENSLYSPKNVSSSLVWSATLAKKEPPP